MYLYNDLSYKKKLIVEEPNKENQSTPMLYTHLSYNVRPAAMALCTEAYEVTDVCISLLITVQQIRQTSADMNVLQDPASDAQCPILHFRQ